MAAFPRAPFGNGTRRRRSSPSSRGRENGPPMNDKTEHVLPPSPLDLEYVKRLLPHRAPFLMIDKLSDIKPGESAVGWKAVSGTEPHFAGHFPEYAVMPGVLIVEAMAQAAEALVVRKLGPHVQQRAVFVLSTHKTSALPTPHPP